MHRFFMLNLADDVIFDELFNKAIILISKIDLVLKNNQLIRLFQAIDTKKKQIKKSFNIRYLAYAYAFFEVDHEYAMAFLKTFMFSDFDNDSLPTIRQNLHILIDTYVYDPLNFEALLKSIVHVLDFGGYKFFLNMIYFCNSLPDFEAIEQFIDYFEKNAKTVYFLYQFDMLKLNEVSSDEDLS